MHAVRSGECSGSAAPNESHSWSLQLTEPISDHLTSRGKVGGSGVGGWGVGAGGRGRTMGTAAAAEVGAWKMAITHAFTVEIVWL